jgi:hypothetical protein
MKILIKPEDIVKRCLWESYQDYILKGKMKNAEEYFKKNEEFEISEEDALVIGLIKVLETPKISHRFKQNFAHYMNLKVIKNGVTYYCNKGTMNDFIQKFKNNFPVEYVCSDNKFKKGINEGMEFVQSFEDQINKLANHTVIINDTKQTCYAASDLKKILDANRA